MKTVGVYELKTHLARLLDEVERGERLLVTRHGKLIAQIDRPPPQRRSEAEIAQIMASARAFREAHPLNGLSIREMIDDGRKH